MLPRYETRCHECHLQRRAVISTPAYQHLPTNTSHLPPHFPPTRHQHSMSPSINISSPSPPHPPTPPPTATMSPPQTFQIDRQTLASILTAIDLLRIRIEHITHTPSPAPRTQAHNSAERQSVYDAFLTRYYSPPHQNTQTHCQHPPSPAQSNPRVHNDAPEYDTFAHRSTGHVPFAIYGEDGYGISPSHSPAASFIVDYGASVARPPRFRTNEGAGYGKRAKEGRDRRPNVTRMAPDRQRRPGQNELFGRGRGQGRVRPARNQVQGVVFDEREGDEEESEQDEGNGDQKGQGGMGGGHGGSGYHGGSGQGGHGGAGGHGVVA